MENKLSIRRVDLDSIMISSYFSRGSTEKVSAASTDCSVDDCKSSTKRDEVLSAAEMKRKMKKELEALQKAYTEAAAGELPKKDPGYTDCTEALQVYDPDLAWKQLNGPQTKKNKAKSHQPKRPHLGEDGKEDEDDEEEESEDDEPKVIHSTKTRKNKKKGVTVPVAIQVNVPPSNNGSSTGPNKNTTATNADGGNRDYPPNAGENNGGNVTIIDRATTQYGIYVNRSGLRECVVCRDYIISPHLTTIKEKDLEYVYCSAGCKHTIWHKKCAQEKMHKEGLPELRWVCEMCKQPAYSERFARAWSIKGLEDTIKKLFWASIIFLGIMIVAGYCAKGLMYMWALDAYNSRPENSTMAPLPPLWGYEFECSMHEQKLVEINLPDGSAGFVMAQGPLQRVGSSYGLWPDRCHFMLASWPVFPIAFVLALLWLIWQFFAYPMRRLMYTIRHKQAEFTN